MSVKCSLLVLIILSCHSKLAFSQELSSWEELYSNNDIKVEVKFKIDDYSCKNKRKNSIAYKVSGTLDSLSDNIVWATDYVDCNGNIIHKQHIIDISIGNPLCNGDQVAHGDTWIYPEDDFFSQKVITKIIDVRRSIPSSSNSNKLKSFTKNANTSFAVLSSGLEYKIIKHGFGIRKPKVSDHIGMYIHVHVGDSILFDSHKMYGTSPIPYPIVAPKFKGDPVEGFMMMVVGDSAVFRLPVDSMKKAGNQLLSWMKSGDNIEYDVVMISIRTEEEEKKVKEEIAAKQKALDDKLLQDYFKKKGIKPMITPSGLYYTISKEGEGEQIKAGQTVSVNYKGKTLDGKVFDTNIDSTFNHKVAFTLEIGIGKVIKGWDEGIPLLKNRSKATLYIPSGLAYGSQDRSSNGIPANSILIFDVEIMEVKTEDK